MSSSASIFLPLIDNGQGAIRANFLLSVLRGFRDMDIHIDRFSDSLPSRARNRAAAHFLRETTRDYLFFIDSDIIFEKEHIDMMMESDEPVLAGIYCKKSKGIEPCINTLPGTPDTPCGGYQEIARAGTGFLRIHRSVLEKMKETIDPAEKARRISREKAVEIAKAGLSEDDYSEFLHHWNPDENTEDDRIARYYVNHGHDEWDFFPVGVVNKEYLSEDWYFCDKARALGFKVMLDTRVQLRHEGSAIFPLDEVVEKLAAEANGKVQVTPSN
jgi:choline kinase